MKKITVAKGDGIGPEIMDATLSILKAANTPIEWDEIEVGEKVYLSGNSTGISPDAWKSIRENKVFLKAPITTPRGGGYKSLNVTMRKTLGLFANVRPCQSYYPFVDTKHPEMDVVIIRENEEDLYAGIEHQQTDEVVQCLKLISRPGSEKIIRYAFEYARVYNKKKVACFVKDNIMKLTDGLFHQVFKEVAAEYPEIEADNWIIDIAAARLADTPEMFEVIVTPNLYGDVVSDIAAQITGSVGLAGSSNVGQHAAMFEAIHGSAPDIAGKNIANPTGLLKGAILMLNHLGLQEYAETINNAWACAIEDGIHTADIYEEGVSKQKVGTKEFAQAVIERLGKKPQQLPAVEYEKGKNINIYNYERPAPRDKKLHGVDVFVHYRDGSAEDLSNIMKELDNDLKLTMITNRGVKIWPNGFEETFCSDHWRCRYEAATEGGGNSASIPAILAKAVEMGVDVIKTENLYYFDGQRAFSLAQGQ